jgi:23S rRNA A2030 N6-methylase RlmJ
MSSKNDFGIFVIRAAVIFIDSKTGHGKKYQRVISIIHRENKDHGVSITFIWYIHKVSTCRHLIEQQFSTDIKKKKKTNHYHTQPPD